MKKSLVILALSTVLFACGGDPAEDARNHEARMLKLQQDHELNMSRIQANNDSVHQATQQVAPYEPQYSQPTGQHNVDGASYGNQSVESSSSDSGIGSTLLAVGAGALAGYAVSELLDDGYRSYTDKSGKSVYVDKSGKQIDKRDYEAYKAKHPTKHKLSTVNQQGKQAINTGATKTVNAANTVKTKTAEVAKKVDQKVVQPVKKKTSSYKSSSSKRR